MKTVKLVLAGMIAFCVIGQSQESTGGIPEGYVALLRSDVQSKKVEIIRQNLTLTEEQAGKFWPLQRSYDNDLSKLNDDRLNVIRDYAKHWDDLSDSVASNLGNRMLDYQKKRVELRKKYFDRISKEITPTVSAKFFQIEMQLEDVIDLGVASSIPLVK